MNPHILCSCMLSARIRNLWGGSRLIDGPKSSYHKNQSLLKVFACFPSMSTSVLCKNQLKEKEIGDSAKIFAMVRKIYPIDKINKLEIFWDNNFSFIIHALLCFKMTQLLQTKIDNPNRYDNTKPLECICWHTIMLLNKHWWFGNRHGVTTLP